MDVQMLIGTYTNLATSSSSKLYHGAMFIVILSFHVCFSSWSLGCVAHELLKEWKSWEKTEATKTSQQGGASVPSTSG